MIGLADCNNFFVSCERSIAPGLEGKAVVVLSNNDGCVVARSNEAKALGIKMGVPAFQIADLIRAKRVIALSGNHLLYRKISLHVHDIMRRFSPETIDYSVDESFLIMDGVPSHALPEIGKMIWKTCRDEASIPVTVGFAPSKTLAKIVCETCKKQGESVGMITSVKEAMPMMQALPISELWGVGRRLAKRMYTDGIYSIADLAVKDVSWVRSKYGVNGERTWRELNGESCIELSHVARPLQDSISESRTFPYDVNDFDYLRARISIYTSHCARQLRSMRGVTQQLGVFLHTNRFAAGGRLQTPQAIIKFNEPTDNTHELVRASIKILESIWTPGVAYKRGGIWLSEIKPVESLLPSLFDTDQELLRRKSNLRQLMRTVDGINSSPATEVIKLASQIVLGDPGHNDGYSSSFQSPSSREKKR